MMQDVRAVAAKGMAPVVKARCGQDEADSWLQLSLHNEKKLEHVKDLLDAWSE